MSDCPKCARLAAYVAAVQAGARYSNALLRLQQNGATRGGFVEGTDELDRLFMDFHDKAHAALDAPAAAPEDENK